MQRKESRIPQPDVEEGASKLEQCRSIVQQLVIRMNGRSHQRHFPWKFGDTSKLLQELSRWKSTASTLVCDVVRQFQTLEEQFGKVANTRDEVRVSSLFPV